MKEKDEWLDFKITEELMAMADEREKQLMEMAELKDVDMPIEKFADIRKAARETAKKQVIAYPNSAVDSCNLIACHGIWDSFYRRQGIYTGNYNRDRWWKNSDEPRQWRFGAATLYRIRCL